MIKLDKRNARVHSKDNKNQIKKSIDELGAGRSVVIDNENCVIGGNGVFEQWGNRPTKIIESDGTELIVVKRTDLATNDSKRKALALADNKINASSKFDDEKIAELLGEIDSDFILSAGFNEKEIKNLLEKYNDSDEPPEGEGEEKTESIPQTKSGDVYILGNHRLMCGSSIIKEDVAKLCNNQEMDLCVTDPPYNIAYKGATEDQLTIKNDDMSNEDFYKFLLGFYENAFFFFKKGGAIYVSFASIEYDNFRKGFVDSGLLYKADLVWVKNNSTLGRGDYNWKHEPILYGWKPGESHYFISEYTSTTVYEEIEKDLKKKDKKALIQYIKELTTMHSDTIIRADKPLRNGEHPTMKPVDLWEKLIINSSRVGENVIDFFGGSGTTIIACEELDRNGFVMEFDPIYCDVIVKRYCKLKNIDSKKVFETKIA